MRNILAAIGLLSVLGMVIHFFAVNDEEHGIAKECLSGTPIILDTEFIDGEYYQVFYLTTGFSDKIEFLMLAKGEPFRSGGCFGPLVVSQVVIYRGEEGKPPVQWPSAIVINGDNVSIEYTSVQKDGVNIFNIVPSWDNV